MFNTAFGAPLSKLDGETPRTDVIIKKYIFAKEIVEKNAGFVQNTASFWKKF
jgi:hypothetical protein